MKKQFWKLWGVLLWICVLSAHITAAAETEDKGLFIDVLSVQKLEEPYDSDAPDIDEAKAGDTVIVTVGFRNNTDAPVTLYGAQFLLEGDGRYLAERPAFELNPDLNWESETYPREDSPTLGAVMGGNNYEVSAGKSVRFMRVAFRVRQDTETGKAEFKLSLFLPDEDDPERIWENGIELAERNRVLNVVQPSRRLVTVTLSAEEAAVWRALPPSPGEVVVQFAANGGFGSILLRTARKIPCQ